MKIKSLLLALVSVMAVAGCRAQQPATTFAIDYTATAPATCTTTAQCQIEYSDAPQTGGSCAATTIPNIACTSALGTTSCVHSNVTAGTTICAVAQTVTAQGVTSVASAPISVVVPALPGAPTNVNGALAASAVAEVKHDSEEQLALNNDGSLQVIKPRHVIHASF